MKEVIKLIEKEVSEKQIDRHQGLNHLLDFLIDMFDIKHYQKDWMNYFAQRKEEEPNLFNIMLIWMEKVSDSMDKGCWIDFFGGLYEEMYQSKSKASTLGQFYTPHNICDLLAKVAQPSFGKISDCACGSGRTLLAAHAKSEFTRSNYYKGEDIDIVSVKMCALNLMIHGCRGEVVRHDTLKEPIYFDYGFRINDIRFPFETPFYSLTPIRYLKPKENPVKEIKEHIQTKIYKPQEQLELF